MRVGTINEESFSEIFRSFSQGRKQGTLRIGENEEAVDIIFVQGRIAAAYPVTSSLTREVAQRIAAGYPDIFIEEEPEAFESLPALFEFLATTVAHSSAWSAGFFAEVVRHTVLDILYGLDLSRTMPYEFKVRAHDNSREFLPGISVGQLLLDFVSLGESAPRIAERYPAQRVVQSRGMSDEDTPRGLSADEQNLFLLAQTPVSLDALRQRSLLSRHHFQEALLGLEDRGLLGDAGSSTDLTRTLTGTDEAFEDDVLSQLESSLSSLLAEEAIQVPLNATINVDHPAIAEAADRVQSTAKEITAVTQRTRRSGIRRAPFLQSLYVMNARILSSSWVPKIVVFLVCLWCLVGPLIFWRDVILWESPFQG